MEENVGPAKEKKILDVIPNKSVSNGFMVNMQAYIWPLSLYSIDSGRVEIVFLPGL